MLLDTPHSRARSDGAQRELDDIAEQLAPIADMGLARKLAFDIIATLLLWFTAHSIGEAFTEDLWCLAIAFNAARGARHDVGEHCARADRLASKFFSRVGPGGSWPFELQIPFDIAVALRRSCEVEVWRFVPLVIHDARALVARHGGDSAALEAMITRAIREAQGDEGARRR